MSEQCIFNHLADDGGGCSLERTALSLHFLLTGNLSGKSPDCELSLPNAWARQAAQFTALIPLKTNAGAEKSREFSRDIKESNFPVRGFQQGKFH